MNADDELNEAYLTLLAAIKDLARSEQLAEHDRLRAIDRTITLALGTSVVDAQDFAEQAALGILGPPGR